MNLVAKIGLLATTLLALGSRAGAADETITVNLFAGDTAAVIAQRLENAWSQSADFGCTRIGDTLFIVDTSGDCDAKIMALKITLPGGTLGSNHTVMLQVQCSPNVVSLALDALPFAVLSLGANSFTSLGDTIDVDYSLPTRVPALPAGAAVGLGVLVAAAGAGLLRRARA